MATKRVVRRNATPAPQSAPPAEYDERPTYDETEHEGDQYADKGKIRPGWGESDKQHSSTSNYAQAFRPDSKAQVIKFLENVPYASFRRHWIATTGADNKPTNRAYTCPLTFDQPCPLCEVGHDVQAVTAFNIAVINED